MAPQLADSARSTRQLSAVDGLVQLSFLIQNALAARAEEADLSLIQTRLLGVLRDRVSTINELASYLDLDKSSVSGLISRAERRGVVERVASAADRRVVVVRITSKGRSLVNKVGAAFEGDVARLLALVSPRDATTLARVTSHLLVRHAEVHGVDLFPRVGVSMVSRT
jgi:DNA-binding MarR family transcriptional regulator